MHKALDCMLDGRGNDGTEIKLTPEQLKAFNASWERAYKPPPAPKQHQPEQHPGTGRSREERERFEQKYRSLAKDATAGSYIVSMLNTLAGTLGPMTGL